MMTQKYDGTDRPTWLDQVLGFFSPPFLAKYGGSATACRLPAAWDAEASPGPAAKTGSAAAGPVRNPG
jgi:hypothetical protein